METIQEKLNITDTLKKGVNLGIANFLQLLIALLLYVLTFWIPYLNVGTTIGLYKLILTLSKDGKVDPFSIFDKENFSQIGDFFLLMAFLYIGVGVGFCFMVIPGIVMSIAWGFAMLILLEKKESPLKSLSLSYDITLGEKWRIFFVNLIASFAFGLVVWLLSLIPAVGDILAFLAGIVFAAIMVGIEATMFKHFALKL